jgi:NADH:ubiquinone oxidoreductase subunit 6 (subunit J)
MEQISGDTGKIINLITMLLLIAALVFAIASSVDYLPKSAPIDYTQWEEGAEDISGIEHIGGLIFTKYVIPFEVLSLILLAALISGLYMAKKEVG